MGLAALNNTNTGNLTRLLLSAPTLAWRDTMTLVSRCHSLRHLELGIRPSRTREAFASFTLCELNCLDVFELEFAVVFRASNLRKLTVRGGLCS